jgi:hypothetical protein
MNSGPPESPKHVFELLPGAPRGDRKAQQTEFVGEMLPVHSVVTTLPERFTP